MDNLMAQVLQRTQTNDCYVRGLALFGKLDVFMKDCVILNPQNCRTFIFFRRFFLGLPRGHGWDCPSVVALFVFFSQTCFWVENKYLEIRCLRKKNMHTLHRVALMSCVVEKKTAKIPTIFLFKEPSHSFRNGFRQKSANLEVSQHASLSMEACYGRGFSTIYLRFLNLGA